MFGFFNREKLRSAHWIFGVMGLMALLGLISSFVLSIDKLTLLRDPNAALSCSINVWVNCASVMKTWQSQVFGFPNSYIGLMGFPIVMAVAVGGLLGVRYNKVFMRLYHGGIFLGLLFAYWLFFQSVFVIQVLCPWCLVVTFAMTLMHEAILRYNILEKNLQLPSKLQTTAESWLKKEYDKVFVGAWIVGMVAIILLAFPGIFAQ